jgi:hypothetical protein
MDPETQKRQWQLLFPTFIGLALLGMLKVFQDHIPTWLALVLYVVLTIFCIANIVRVIRLNKRSRG